MEQPILDDEQKAAFTWIQTKLESVENLEKQIELFKVITKNLIQIIDNVTVLAPYRKSPAYEKIKDAIANLG